MDQDYEFRMTTSDLSDMIGKTHITPELTFMKCTAGSAVIQIDSIEHTLSTQHSFILSDYVIFQVVETTADFSVTYISISASFYYEIVARFDGAIFGVLLHSAPELYSVSDLRAADLLFENLCLLHDNQGHNNRRSMAMNLIACYIYEMYELTLPHINENITEGKKNQYTDTVVSFYKLVSIYGYNNRNIEFYAEKLNMSSRYLYKIIQSAYHMTPKQLIDDTIVSLIKQLLLTTSLNNQQISDKFNFSDPSAFGQYFKRYTGLSPSAFRNKHK